MTLFWKHYRLIGLLVCALIFRFSAVPAYREYHSSLATYQSYSQRVQELQDKLKKLSSVSSLQKQLKDISQTHGSSFRLIPVDPFQFEAHFTLEQFPEVSAVILECKELAMSIDQIIWDDSIDDLLIRFKTKEL